MFNSNNTENENENKVNLIVDGEEVCHPEVDGLQVNKITDDKPLAKQGNKNRLVIVCTLAFLMLVAGVVALSGGNSQASESKASEPSALGVEEDATTIVSNSPSQVNYEAQYEMTTTTEGDFGYPEGSYLDDYEYELAEDYEEAVEQSLKSYEKSRFGHYESKADVDYVQNEIHIDTGDSVSFEMPSGNIICNFGAISDDKPGVECLVKDNNWDLETEYDDRADGCSSKEIDFAVLYENEEVGFNCFDKSGIDFKETIKLNYGNLIVYGEDEREGESEDEYGFGVHCMANKFGLVCSADSMILTLSKTINNFSYPQEDEIIYTYPYNPDLRVEPGVSKSFVTPSGNIACNIHARGEVADISLVYCAILEENFTQDTFHQGYDRFDFLYECPEDEIHTFIFKSYGNTDTGCESVERLEKLFDSETLEYGVSIGLEKDIEESIECGVGTSGFSCISDNAYSMMQLSRDHFFSGSLPG